MNPYEEAFNEKRAQDAYNAAELSAARAQEPLTDATKASCALGYEECSHRCGTPHVCCDHYVEPEPIATPTTPVREPLSDNAIAALRQAIAQPATTEWTVIAPDGTRFTGPTPLKAALPASKYRLEIDPVAAVKFMEIIDQEAEKGRQEAEQCMRDYGTLDCPACGGSGHIGDVKQPAQVPAGSIRLWDAQWVSIVNHDNAYNGWSTNDAVNHAVRMTERYIAANVAQNNLPPLPAVKP